MSTTRYASFHVLSATKGGRGATSGLRKSAHRADFSHIEPREGYIYVRSRAISSRTNDNFDTFPAAEIKKAWRTFIGKPVFVNHHNDDPKRARGVIVDAALHEDVSPFGEPDTWVEVLMEVDAVRFPKLAAMVLSGDIDKTSMGCSVERSRCSFCGNEAESPIDFCKHVKSMKGRRINRTTASGVKEAVLVSEICLGISFFENSLLVETPADPTATAFVDPDLNKSHFSKAASKTASFPGIESAVPFATPKGTVYMIDEASAVVARSEDGRQVGYITWYSADGTINNLDVRPEWRRQGIATELFRRARAIDSWVAHSEDRLSNDAKAWIKSLPADWQVTRKASRTGTSLRTASRDWSDNLMTNHHALDEQIAPPKVDTLRDSVCSVCGSPDSIVDGVCQTCGFEEPTMFAEPDTLSPQIEDLRDDGKPAFLQCTECHEKFPTIPPERREKAEAQFEDDEEADDGLGKTSVLVGYDAQGSAVHEDATCPVCEEGTLVPGSDEPEPTEDPEESDDSDEPDDEEQDEDDEDDEEKIVSARRTASSDDQRYELYVGDDGMPVAYFASPGEAFDAAKSAGESDFSVIDSHTGDAMKEGGTTASLRTATQNCGCPDEYHLADCPLVTGDSGLSEADIWAQEERRLNSDTDWYEGHKAARATTTMHNQLASKEEAMMPKDRTAHRRTSAYSYADFPLVDNPNFPGEKIPSCPKCGGYVVDSSASNGMPGWLETSPIRTCKNCGTVYPMEDNRMRDQFGRHLSSRRRTAGFWEEIEAQLALVRQARTVNDVIAALGGSEGASAGDAFFGGSGGDETLFGALIDAGWRVRSIESDYYFVATSPGGEALTYIEGDVYRGNRTSSRRQAHRRTAVSLSNIGKTDDPLVFTGKDPSGKQVKFKVTEQESKDLKAILYSDMAMNFSGVDVDESEIIKDASSRRTANGIPDNNQSSQCKECSTTRAACRVGIQNGQGPCCGECTHGEYANGVVSNRRTAISVGDVVERKNRQVGSDPSGETLTVEEVWSRPGDGAQMITVRTAPGDGTDVLSVDEVVPVGTTASRRRRQAAADWGPYNGTTINGYWVTTALNMDDWYYLIYPSFEQSDEGQEIAGPVFVGSEKATKAAAEAAAMALPPGSSTSAENESAWSRTSSFSRGPAPAWLNERNNDGYGTPKNHEFWNTVDFEDVNGWRIFNKDGLWYGYKLSQNAWSNGATDKADIVAMADPGRQVDVWASRKTKESKMSNRRTADYNGWPNRETWSAFSWLANDYDVYHKVVAAPSPEALKGIYAQIPGRDKVDESQIDWQAVYEGFSDDRTGSRKATTKESKMDAQERRRMKAAIAIQARRGQKQQERIAALEGVLREVIAATGVRTPKAASLVLASEDEHGDGKVAETDQQALPESTDVESEGKVKEAPAPKTTDDPQNEGGTDPDNGFNKSDDPESVVPGDGVTNESDSERTFTSMRLARLRIEAGVETGDDLTLGQKIAKSPASMESIRNEVETLTKVMANRTASANEVPTARPLPTRSPSQIASLASLVAASNSGGSVSNGGSRGTSGSLIGDTLI